MSDSFSDRPRLRGVFIGGCERSGTTLLGSMLGAAPGAVCTPESQFKRPLLREFAQGKYDAARGVRELLAHYKFHAWEFAADAAALGRAAPGGPGRLLEALVRQFGAAHGTPDAQVWIDHTPDNLRLARLLAAQFPSSTFIHIVRDGRAVAASLLRQNWGPSHIEEAAPYWQVQVGVGLTLEHGDFGLRVIRVRYEDLVETPQPVLRRLCEFTGLTFVPEMLAGTGFRGKPDAIRGTHELVGQAPKKERVDAWKNQLSARDIEIFEDRAELLLTMLGYPLVYGGAATPITPTEHRMLELRSGLTRAANAFKRTRERLQLLRKGRSRNGARTVL